MDLTIINLGIGLVGLMTINIILGSIDSLFYKSFDKFKLWKGILKSGVVTFCAIGIYGIGYINPTVIVLDIDGQSVNLLTAVALIVMSAFIFYGKQCVDKLSKIIIGEKSVDELKKK